MEEASPREKMLGYLVCWVVAGLTETQPAASAVQVIREMRLTLGERGEEEGRRRKKQNAPIGEPLIKSNGP